MTERELKRQNASRNDKTQVETTERESKRQNASQNDKKRVETTKRELKLQNASWNYKTRVETTNASRNDKCESKWQMLVETRNRESKRKKGEGKVRFYTYHQRWWFFDFGL